MVVIVSLACDRVDTKSMTCPLIVSLACDRVDTKSMTCPLIVSLSGDRVDTKSVTCQDDAFGRFFCASLEQLDHLRYTLDSRYTLKAYYGSARHMILPSPHLNANPQPEGMVSLAGCDEIQVFQAVFRNLCDCDISCRWPSTKLDS